MVGRLLGVFNTFYIFIFLYSFMEVIFMGDEELIVDSIEETQEQEPNIPPIDIDVIGEAMAAAGRR